jgi:Tol biopolymer transport system component
MKEVYASQGRPQGAAHDKGVVHRDLKPESLFITKDGAVKILDFRLAKLKAESVAGANDTQSPTFIRITDPGVVLGTVGYMSPEQVRGEDADHRSDLFALGSILYEMLSGRLAFDGASAADVMSAILRDEPPELPAINAAASVQLDRLMRHCLEKKPEKRFQSASDLAFDLEMISGQSGSGASAITEALVPGRTGWRRRVLLAAAMLLIAVALLASGILLGKDLWKTPLPTYRQLTFRRGATWDAKFAPDGQTIVYGASWNGGPWEVFSTRTDSLESRALGLVNADILAISGLGEMAVQLNRHNWQGNAFRGTLARMPLAGGVPREIAEDVQEADWSPDGTNLAIVRYVGGRQRLEYPVGTVLYETDAWISMPRVSPRGNEIAFIYYPGPSNVSAIMLIDRAGVRKALFDEATSRLDSLAWSPSGDEVWFSASKGGEAEAIYAVTTQGRERVVARAPSDLILLDISREGRVLLARSKISTDIIGLAPGETKERDLSWIDASQVCDVSADGRELVFLDSAEGSGVNGYAYLRKTDGSPPVRLGEGIPMALSPDRKQVLSLLVSPPQLLLLPTGPGEPRRLERNGIEAYSVAYWLPDGRRFIFTAREPERRWRCYIQDIESGTMRPITPEGIVSSGGLRGYKGSLISPDGRLLVCEDEQSKKALYPVDGDGGPTSIRGLDPEDQVARWGADGRSLLVFRAGKIPIKVSRLDLLTGRKELVREVTPADKAGIVWPPLIYLSADGRAYVYSVQRQLYDLYLADGLK